MKKYILTFFAFSFVFLGFFNINTPSAHAYDAGCTALGQYSITTGQFCGSQYNYSNPTYVVGCTSNYGYSSVTGQSCVTQNNYLNNNAYIPGCTGAGPYSIITGQLCSGSQLGYQTNTYIPGCTAGNPFSSVTGQSCYPTQNNTYIAGCTGAGPYSIITGQPCHGSGINSGNTFLNQQFYIGQTGADVAALQQMLNNAGFMVGVVDGVYGPATDRAFSDYKSQYPNQVVPPVPCPLVYVGGIAQHICQTTNQAPIISGVSGPQSLNVNQTGTWTVNAYSNSNYNAYSNNLSYSVNWGDQNVYPYYLSANSAQGYYPQQNATFTHAYAQTGRYTAIFTVTNSTGQTAQSSLSVVVGGGSNSYGVPTISYLSPTSGVAGTQVTIYGTGFNTSTGNCNIYGSCSNSLAVANTITFGTNVIQVGYSSNGTSLTFTVPSYNTPACYYSYPPCAMQSTTLTPGIYPVYVTTANGLTSNTVNFTVTGNNQSSSPAIYSLNPSTGSIGATVTINGAGFAYTNNIVHFALSGANGGFTSAYLPYISSNGNNIIFSVPSYSSLACEYADPRCYPQDFALPSGTYNVWFENSLGTSNQVQFILY